MGFSTNVSLIFASGAGANTLNGRGGLPALSTISATSGPEGVNFPQVKIDPTTAAALTAFITGFSFAQTVYNGGAAYVAEQNGIYNCTNLSNLPFQIFYNASYGNNSTGYSLSATGQVCASGLQIGTMYYQLSSTALSATSAGTVIPVTVTNPLVSFDGVNAYPTASLTFSAYCINTPFPSDNPVYVCQGEFARIQQYLG